MPARRYGRYPDGRIAADAVVNCFRLSIFDINNTTNTSPDSSATSAIAPTSSREMELSLFLGVMSFWMNSTLTTIGQRQTIRARIITAAKPIKDFQWVVPMVLGMISAKMRISTVITALTRPNRTGAAPDGRRRPHRWCWQSC